MKENKKDFVITGNDTKSTDVKIDSNEDLTSNVTISHSDEKVNIIERDFITFDTRTQKELEFLWKPYIVKGNINIIQSDGGLGKSYLITWLMSAISKGDKIPFSDENFEVGNCILQNAEDDIDATILPRLNLHGADTSRIGFMNEEIKLFKVQDYKRLEEHIKEYKPVVICLDPIQSFLGNINMNMANEVREALKPLKKLAQKYNVAIIIIMHLNKNSATTKATYRTMGSYDFVAMARSVLLITENPENTSERLLIPIKTNIMKESEKRTLSYKINDNGVIEWLEDKGKIDPNEILGEADTNYIKSSVAKGFILGALSNGDILGNDLRKLALEKGNISEKTFNVVKADLRKNNIIDNYQKEKQFYWTLKEGEEKND